MSSISLDEKRKADTGNIFLLLIFPLKSRREKKPNIHVVLEKSM